MLLEVDVPSVISATRVALLETQHANIVAGMFKKKSRKLFKEAQFSFKSMILELLYKK